MTIEPLLNSNNPADISNRDRWKDYEVAVEDMMWQTSTKRSQWYLVPANNKPYARLAAFTRKQQPEEQCGPATLDQERPGIEKWIYAHRSVSFYDCARFPAGAEFIALKHHCA